MLKVPRTDVDMGVRGAGFGQIQTGVPEARARRWLCNRRRPATSVTAAWAKISCLAANAERMPCVCGTRERKTSTENQIGVTRPAAGQSDTTTRWHGPGDCPGHAETSRRLGWRPPAYPTTKTRPDPVTDTAADSFRGTLSREAPAGMGWDSARHVQSSAWICPCSRA